VWRFVLKAVDETNIIKSLGVKKQNGLLTINKLANNVAGLITSDLWPDVAHAPPVAPQ
jgi:hypothetical protein